MTDNQSNRRAITLALMVTFGGFVFGLDAALISGTFGYLTSQWSLSPGQVGWVGGAAGLGVLPALFLTGLFVDWIGRKGALIIIALLYLLSAIGSAFAPNYEFLGWARFLGGMAFASLSVSAMYLGEVAPADKRGMMVSINQLAIVFGLLAAFLINFGIQQWADQPGWPETIGLHVYTWQWMLGIEIPFVVLWLVMLLRIPESPRWLILRGQKEKAAAVLERLLPASEVHAAIAEIEQNIAEETHGEGQRNIFDQIGLLFTPGIRLAMLIGIILVVVQPTTGINAINTYAPMVFSQAGIGVDAAFATTVWLGVVSVAGTLAAIMLIDRIGRRTILMVGLVAAALGLSACALGFSKARYSLDSESVGALPAEIDRSALAPLIGEQFIDDVALKSRLKEVLGSEVFAANEGALLEAATDLNIALVLGGVLLFIFAFQFSIGPVMWVILSELFPTAVRGVAIPVCGLVLSGVNFVIQYFFPIQLASWGAMSIFAFYAGAVLVGLALLGWLLPETKGKSIEQIAAELGMGKKALA